MHPFGQECMCSFGILHDQGFSWPDTLSWAECDLPEACCQKRSTYFQMCLNSGQTRTSRPLGVQCRPAEKPLFGHEGASVPPPTSRKMPLWLPLAPPPMVLHRNVHPHSRLTCLQSHQQHHIHRCVASRPRPSYDGLHRERSTGYSLA